MERFFARYEFTTRYLLCSSDPESMPVSELLALEPGADRRLAQLRLGYIDSRGTPELRNAIASLYDDRNAEQILAHSGTQEPIFAFMHATLAPGDHLVVQFPAYQSHYSIAESFGAEVTRWEADLDRGGAPDIGELERLVRPQTRAIVITSPNNPTGYQFKPVASSTRSSRSRESTGSGCWRRGLSRDGARGGAAPGRRRSLRTRRLARRNG